MGSVIGELLPLALGIAVSPVPIIAAILMLLSPKAQITSIGFLIGWVAGIVVAVAAFTLLSGVLPEGGPGEAHPVTGVIKLVLGALLIVLAVRNWRGRPKPGQTAALPGWMKAIETFTFVKALGLAFLLSGVNPKNLLLGAAAGVTIGGAGLAGGEVVFVIVVFTLIAAATVLVPVVGYQLAADKLARPLMTLRDWLQKENAVIMAVLLLVLGVNLIGTGIGSF
ncbi:GAP family protein [Ornithinimicrobium sp. Arc0846-15]|nr:GAP family protein [Ornithinimicrobium laminariae]